MKDLRYRSDKVIAAHAVRERSTIVIAQALDWLFQSTAMQDYRDVVSSLTLYSDALTRLGEDADAFLTDYARMNHASSRHIRSFVLRSPDLKTLASAGYKALFDREFRYEDSWK